MVSWQKIMASPYTKLKIPYTKLEISSTLGFMVDYIRFDHFPKEKLLGNIFFQYLTRNKYMFILLCLDLNDSKLVFSYTLLIIYKIPPFLILKLSIGRNEIFFT
jgi:hypothetical protein